MPENAQDLTTKSTEIYDMKMLKQILPLCESNLYKLVHLEGFPKFVVGRKILIPRKAFENWLDTVSVEQRIFDLDGGD